MVPAQLLKAVAAVSLFSTQAWAVSYNGLAITPQMGWVFHITSRMCRLLADSYQDNWNAFGCNVSETLLLGTAQKIVDYGLRDLGYYYIVLDDCWSSGRTANGTLQPNMTKFPNGMKHTADQLHNMGLGFGMYSSAGTYTCGQYGTNASSKRKPRFADIN